MRPIETEGNFQAKIIQYALNEAESGALAIHIRAHILAHHESGEWLDDTDTEIIAEGDIWIIKKDGTPNEPGVQSLVNHAGWDTCLESIVEETWTPLPCVVTVRSDEYKGVTRHKIAFLNSWSWQPRGNVSKQRARQLQEKYGQELALFRPPDSERPSHPAEVPVPAPAHDYTNYPPGGEQIPF